CSRSSSSCGASTRGRRPWPRVRTRSSREPPRNLRPQGDLDDACGMEAQTLTSLMQEHALREAETLCQVVEEISSEVELRPLLTRIVTHACELLGADDGAIGLFDPVRKVIRTEAIYRMPAREQGAEVAA